MFIQGFKNVTDKSGQKPSYIIKTFQCESIIESPILFMVIWQLLIQLVI